MIWCVEYSPVQGAFHVDTLERALDINRQTVEEGRVPGYVILAITRTHEEARAFCDCWRQEHLREAGV